MREVLKIALMNYIKEIFFVEEKNVRRLFFNCVDKEAIFFLNERHLGHSWETDVLTFAYKTEEGLDGEVFICKEVVEENAKRYKKESEIEFIRVFFHAVLHLCGYLDNTEKEKREMREKEEFHLKMFHVKQKYV